MNDMCSLELANIAASAECDLKKYIDILNDALKVPIDNESLFIKCYVYLDHNYPQLKAYQRAQIIWHSAVLGEIFNF